MRRALPASTLLLALLTHAGSSAAQPTPTGADTALQVTVGKALLEEGKKLAQDGHLPEALEKLEASVRNDPSPEALLELATCQEKLGATASAWGTLHRAGERAQMLNDAGRAGEAATRAAALDPKLSRVRVVVTASATEPQVTIDNRWVLAESTWGVPLPLDPGAHHLTASSPGKPSFATTFELVARPGTLEVLVPELGTPPAMERAVPAAREAPTPVEQSASTSASAPPPGRTWTAPTSHPHRRDVRGLGWGLLLGGGGVMGLAVLATSIYASASNANPDVVVGMGLFAGVGLAPTLVGLVLVLADPQNIVVRNPLPLNVGPMVARSGGGLSFHGAF